VRLSPDVSTNFVAGGVDGSVARCRGFDCLTWRRDRKRWMENQNVQYANVFIIPYIICRSDYSIDLSVFDLLGD
jgi:hypothetical protein